MERQLLKKKCRFFETYIFKILKQFSDCNNSITSNAKQQLNSILIMFTKIIVQNCYFLIDISKKKTITQKQILSSISLCIDDKDFLQDLKNYGEKALLNYSSSKDTKLKSSRQEKASIIFSPSLLENFLRKQSYIVNSESPVFLSAIIEYITLEILRNSCYYTNENKHIRITIRDIYLGVYNNKNLYNLFKRNNLYFLGGGVNPFIHQSLFNKKSKKKYNKKDKNNNHRFRPGTVSIREIKKYQKTSDCLIFSKFSFEKLVRSIIKENCQIKVSKDVFIVLQYFIEQRIVNTLYNANSIAIHSGRVKVVASDIELSNTIKSN